MSGDMRTLPLLATVIACGLVLSACTAAGGEEEETARGDGELRNAAEAPFEKPEVGMVYGQAGKRCSGTLIGERTVLTVPSCIEGTARAPVDEQRRLYLHEGLGMFHITTAKGEGELYQVRAIASTRTVPRVGGSGNFAVLELDERVPADVARPASLAREWPKEDLTIYGYGDHGSRCQIRNRDHQKRKTTISSEFPFVPAQSCLGDEGGPMFRGTTSEIVAVTTGALVNMQRFADVIAHRDWIIARLYEAEHGELAK